MKWRNSASLTRKSADHREIWRFSLDRSTRLIAGQIQQVEAAGQRVRVRRMSSFP